jgi:hypothetical protein
MKAIVLEISVDATSAQQNVPWGYEVTVNGTTLL